MRLILEGRLEETDDNQSSFSITETVQLGDGRLLALAEDRGWTVSRAGISDLSTLDLIRAIDNATLPDDAEETGERRTWDRYIRASQERHSVPLDPQDLRSAAVEFRLTIAEHLIRETGSTE